MAVIRLTHPIHGSYIESSEAAADKAAANGWSRETAVVPEAPTRKRRKRDEQVIADDDRS